MKRFKSVILIFIAVLCMAFPAWAQTAKVVDVKGNVQVKETPVAEWQKANINMVLEKDAEIQTQKDSACTLAFDEELKNILTVKENSHIKLEQLSPGRVYLPEGRVFVLIDNLAKAETFEVRTPTAIAGARGTGWMTGFANGISTALSFQNTIFVQGLDPLCPSQEEKDAASGYGYEIGGGCAFSGPFPIGDKEWQEWEDFLTDTKVLRGDITEPDDNKQALEDIEDDIQEDASEVPGEERRRDAESGQEGEPGYDIGR